MVLNDHAKRRVWRSKHVGTEEEMLKIRAVEITASHVGDAPVRPDLLSLIPMDEGISRVTVEDA